MTAAARSVAVQALGACMTLGIAVLISRNFGIEVQGKFGLLKGWTDIMTAICSAGLPQAVLHLVYQDGQSAKNLHSWIVRYCAVLLGMAIPAGLIVTVLFHSRQWSWVAIATPALVYHGLIRVLMLRFVGIVTYAWITIAPAMTLFAGVALLSLFGLSSVEWAVAASGWLSGCAAGAIALAKGVKPSRVVTQPTQAIWRINGQSFFQNICWAAQVGAILLLFVILDTGSIAIGEASFAFYFLQAFSILATFLAPAVYDRYARTKAVVTAVYADRSRLRRLAIATTALSLGGISCVPWAVVQFFPDAYHHTAVAAVWMAMAGLILLLNRFFATVLQAAGQFAELSVQGGTRLLLGLALTVVLYKVFVVSAAQAAGIAQFLTELVLLGRGWWALGRCLQRERRLVVAGETA